MRQRPTHRKLTLKPYNVLLPLLSKVIFVDWNGVLCRDVFWSSIANNDKHPYHSQLNESRQRLFKERREVVGAWQRGEIPSEQVIGLLNINLDRRYRYDFLKRRLERDCKRMTTDLALLKELQEARSDCFVVLATDNVDCFFEQLDAKPEVRSTMDAVLCSSALGVLKSDNVVRFFKPWLDQHQLDFSDAVLLDDSAAICEEFRRAGGAAIVVTSIPETINMLRSWRSSF
jgi:FMN phosphatase YigB (HAD superfamily)